MWFCILPVPAFVFLDLDGGSGAPAGEDWGKGIALANLITVLNWILLMLPDPE